MTVAGQSEVSFSAAVLGGGASRRMGTDKAALDVDGHTMAERVAGAAGRAGAVDVVQIGGTSSHLTVVPDRWPGQGPLGGIITALATSRSPWVFGGACDLPGHDGPTIGLLTAHIGQDADVIMAVTDRREPLCALWRVAGARGLLTAQFATGERAVHIAVAALRVIEVHVATSALHNVNTPDELAEARRLAQRPIRATRNDPGSPSVLRMSIAEITVEEVAARLSDGAVLFDVRELDEYVEAHAPGATFIPLSEMAERADEFPTDGDLLIICKSGGRSMRACEFLAERGVQATNVAGGTGAWIRAGFEVVTGNTPT